MNKVSLIIIFLSFTILQISAQEKVKIDPTKPSAYINFVRSGKGKSVYANDSEERVWLKFINNTRWSIYLSIFDLGNNEKGIHYKVERIKEDSSNKEIPAGYLRGHGGSPDSELKPGKSIIFSVPQNHLADNLKIIVNFTYKWEYTSSLDYSYSIPENVIYVYSYELEEFLKSKEKAR